MQLGDGLGDRAGPPVGAGRGHAVEGVGHRQHPGELGDLVPRQAHGVTPAVDALVVVHDAGQRLVQEADLPDDFEPAHRVQLDGGVLLFGQLPGLLQHLGGHPQLAHVMQHARVPDGLDPLGMHPDRAGDHDRSPRYALAVAPGIEVLGLHRLAEHPQGGLVGTLLVGELGNGPARHEQRDQHQDRRERPDDAPQRGDQQAEDGIPEVRQWKAQVKHTAAARRRRAGAIGEPQDTGYEPVVRDDVGRRRAHERPDQLGKGIAGRDADVPAERQEDLPGAVGAERVHRAVEHALRHAGTAAQGERADRTDQGRAGRPDQNDGGQRGGVTR